MKSQLLPGLDGEKMSKSKSNDIPLFLEPENLRKTIMKIKTDSSPPEAPKISETSTLFNLYKAFATPDQSAKLSQKYKQGIGWGEVKVQLFSLLERFF